MEAEDIYSLLVSLDNKKVNSDQEPQQASEANEDALHTN